MEAPAGGEQALRHRAAWRQVAYMDTIAMRHDLDDLCDKHDQGNVDDIECLLKHARTSVTGISGPWAWFQGTAQEQTFLALHEAQWRLLLVMKSEYLLSRLPALITFCGIVLGADDERVSAARDIMKRSGHRRFLPFRLQVNHDAAHWHAIFRLSEHERATAFPAVPATGWAELLMWAVAFGAAQQAITRFVDIRVRGLIGDALGRDEAATAMSPAPAVGTGTRKRAAPATRITSQADSEDA